MTDGPKLNILRHSSMYLCERESNAFLKSMSRIRDFLPVDMFHEVQDVNDVGSNNDSRHVGLLLLPSYFTDEGTEPLGNATRGKLVVD